MKLRKKRISRREGIKRGIHLLPNLCTTGSLFCGFFAIIKVLHGEFVDASWAILLAGIFDLFDGQLARLTRAASQFGVEYDSLVDLASFGLAPALLMYVWSLQDFKRLGWIVAFLFFACGALRLARYNVQADSEESRFFQGLPIPMAAYVLATTVIFYDGLYDALPQKNIWILGLTLSLALMMVSTLRFRNAKEWNLKTRLSFFVLVGGAVVIAFVAWEPFIMMWAVSLGYAATGPLEELFWWLKEGKRMENAPISHSKKPVTLIHSAKEPASREAGGEQ